MSDDARGGPERVPPAAEVTRSQEQLTVRLPTRPYARAVVRKVVVTEQVTLTVTVRREELRVKRIPLADGTGDGAAGGHATDAPRELTEGLCNELVLHAERPVVSMRAVPVERVRVHKVIVTGEQEVSDEVRVERVDTEVDAAHDPDAGRV